MTEKQTSAIHLGLERPSFLASEDKMLFLYQNTPKAYAQKMRICEKKSEKSFGFRGENYFTGLLNSLTHSG